jgi:hypothetical protein
VWQVYFQAATESQIVATQDLFVGGDHNITWREVTKSNKRSWAEITGSFLAWAQRLQELHLKM